VILQASHPAWAMEFAHLQRVLLANLGPLAVRVEHIGSTAVPGLVAKPILDVDIVINNMGCFAATSQALSVLGYRHAGDQGIAEREVFKRSDEHVPWGNPQRAWMNQHVYVCPLGSKELARHLRFRDALRSDATLRDDYAAFKLRIAEQSFGDRKVYAQLKQMQGDLLFGRF
jgi:GrpB-like predicted nucleotidyltransferase (UPF0157 family)